MEDNPLNRAAIAAMFADGAKAREWLQSKLGSDEFHSLQNVLERVTKNVMQEQRFNELARHWKNETRFQSSIAAKSIHPAYQKIIGMGEAAVPFILRDLSTNEPNDWFWALTMITDENPITDAMAGNMKEMTEAWLQWGRKVGYLKEPGMKRK